jgi:hypothetical protein
VAQIVDRAPIKNSMTVGAQALVSK